MSVVKVSDSRKCYNGIFQLVASGVVLYFPGWLQKQSKIKIPSVVQPFVYLTMYGSGIGLTKILYRNAGVRNTTIFLPEAIAKVWRDCGGGGWFKKHREGLQRKLREMSEKVKDKVRDAVPDLSPPPTPVPIRVHRVPTRAVPVVDHGINWTAGFETFGYGLLTAGAAALTAAAATGTVAAVLCPADGPAVDLVMGGVTAETAAMTGAAATAAALSAQRFMESLR